jgi:hypothetical protein
MKGWEDEMTLAPYRLLITLILIFAFISLPTSVEAKGVPLRYTRRLPRIDKVELQKLKASEMWIDSIEATKVIEGIEARAVAVLWRTQRYRSISADCHYPAYGIKFYARGKVVLYASLCWQCNNIAYIEPKLGATQGFDGESSKGKELLELFSKAFS